MKNRIIFALSLLLFVFIILSDLTVPRDIKKIEKKVKEYLKEKYHEEFNIDSINVDKYVYDEEELDDAYIYEFDVSSSRLTKFKLYYYEYDNNSFEKNNIEDLVEPGIYENYIYEYKIKEFENKYYKDILNIIDKSSNIEFSLDNMQVGLYNILLLYKNSSKEDKELFDKYYGFNKRVSDKEFLDTYFEISKTNELIINMDVNKEINDDNIESFKNDIRNLVLFLKENNIDYYDINMNLNGYVNARATRYTDNNKEQIYLVFDYPSYFDIKDSFNVIVFDL